MLNYSVRVVAVLLVLFGAAAVDPTDEELRARIVRTRPVRAGRASRRH